MEPPSSRDLLLLLLHHPWGIPAVARSHSRTRAHARTVMTQSQRIDGRQLLPYTQRWRSFRVVEITSTDRIRSALWITQTRRFIYIVVLLHSGRRFIAAQSNPTLSSSSSALTISDSVLARRRGGGPESLAVEFETDNLSSVYVLCLFSQRSST